jgi:hypothetical protein
MRIERKASAELSASNVEMTVHEVTAPVVEYEIRFEDISNSDGWNVVVRCKTKAELRAVQAKINNLLNEIIGHAEE